MKTVLLAAAVAFVMSIGVAHADVAIIGGTSTDPNRPNCFTTEAGQGVPTGVCGFVNGSFNINTPEELTWTYLGHGDSAQPDSMTIIDANNVSHIFCTAADPTIGCGAPTPIGTSFTAPFTAGPPDYFYTVDRGGGNTPTLQHDQSNDALGAALLQIGLGSTPNRGPGPIGYIGLSDLLYPTDHDFQDLTASVSQVPEPAALPFLGASLLGLALYARRRRNLAK